MFQQLLASWPSYLDYHCASILSVNNNDQAIVQQHKRFKVDQIFKFI